MSSIPVISPYINNCSIEARVYDIHFVYNCTCMYYHTHVWIYSCKPGIVWYFIFSAAPKSKSRQLIYHMLMYMIYHLTSLSIVENFYGAVWRDALFFSIHLSLTFHFIVYIIRTYLNLLFHVLIWTPNWFIIFDPTNLNRSYISGGV